jgi:Kef-type K+ transport system membrane component KefB
MYTLRLLNSGMKLDILVMEGSLMPTTLLTSFDAVASQVLVGGLATLLRGEEEEEEEGIALLITSGMCCC